MVEIGTEFRFCWKSIVVGPKWLKSELSSDYLAALDFALQCTELSESSLNTLTLKQSQLKRLEALPNDFQEQALLKYHSLNNERKNSEFDVFLTWMNLTFT
jgi:hypothetical protein